MKKRAIMSSENDLDFLLEYRPEPWCKKETFRLRNRYLKLAYDYAEAHMHACEVDPAFAALVCEKEELEDDLNVVHHKDKAGEMGDLHLQKVLLWKDINARVRQYIAQHAVLRALEEELIKAKSKHLANWDKEVTSYIRASL